MVRANPESPKPVEEKVAACLKDGLPAKFDGLASEKTIRATFVRDLLFKCVTNRAVAPVGVAITGARIEGDLKCLRLGSLSAPLPALDLSDCDVVGDVDLTDSCFSSVTLTRCSLRSLTAPWLNVGSGLGANDLVFTASSYVLVNLEGLVSAGDVTLKAVYAITGWLIVTLAALIGTFVLRREVEIG